MLINIPQITPNDVRRKTLFISNFKEVNLRPNEVGNGSHATACFLGLNQGHSSKYTLKIKRLQLNF